VRVPIPGLDVSVTASQARCTCGWKGETQVYDVQAQQDAEQHMDGWAALDALALALESVDSPQLTAA
jgi:uncharacterized protein (DUF427 family)